MYNGTQYAALFCMDVVEVACHLFTCPISALNFYLILQTSVLHPNLKFILICQSLCIFIRGTDRLIVLAIRFFTGEVAWGEKTNLLMLIYLFPIVFRNYLAHVLVTERVIATLMVRSYEKQRNPLFSVLWFSILISSTFINIYLVKQTTSHLYLWLTYVFVISLAIVEIFGCLWRFSNKSYCKKFNQMHKLSERYQLSENIRTTKQMIPPLIFHFSNLCIGTVAATIAVFQLFPSQFASDFQQELWMILSTIFCFMIEFTMIIYHPFLRRNLRRLLHKLLCANNSSASSANKVGPSRGRSSNVELRNIHGQLLLQLGDQNSHFEMLVKSWEQKL